VDGQIRSSAPGASRGPSGVRTKPDLDVTVRQHNVIDNKPPPQNGSEAVRSSMGAVLLKTFGRTNILPELPLLFYARSPDFREEPFSWLCSHLIWSRSSGNGQSQQESSPLIFDLTRTPSSIR
jgi:hypothetical protein